MKECDFEDSLETAEIACKEHLERRLGWNIRRSAAKGLADEAVFDIGHLQTGDQMAFPAKAFHWRAQLDIYRRDRSELQKALMRVIQAFPINRDTNADADLRESSNVELFRIALETNAVSAITRTEVTPPGAAGPMLTNVATILFDVVFRAAGFLTPQP